MALHPESEMTTPPPYSEAPNCLIKPEIEITASSLKSFIVGRDHKFASFIVKLILKNFESLRFQTPQPLTWAFAPVLYSREMLILG
jgi:hypothetical protein